MGRKRPKIANKGTVERKRKDDNLTNFFDDPYSSSKIIELGQIKNMVIWHILLGETAQQLLIN